MSKLANFLLKYRRLDNESKFVYVMPEDPANSYHIYTKISEEEPPDTINDSWRLVGSIASLGIKPLDKHKAMLVYFLSIGYTLNISLVKIGGIVTGQAKYTDSRIAEFRKGAEIAQQKHLVTKIDEAVGRIVEQYKVKQRKTVVITFSGDRWDYRADQLINQIGYVFAGNENFFFVGDGENLGDMDISLTDSDVVIQTTEKRTKLGDGRLAISSKQASIDFLVDLMKAVNKKFKSIKSIEVV